MIQELPLWFNTTFATLYYLHPAGGKPSAGGIRERHIRNLSKACDKYNVEFREVTSDPDEFLKSLEEDDIKPRLVIADDLGAKLFQSDQAYEVFTRVSHHNKTSFVSN